MYEQEISRETQKCAWCGGTGNKALSASYVVSCVVCAGKGCFTTLEPAARCHQCLGTGRRNQFDSCPTCIGRGWIIVFGQG
ncbi:MAG TPA: hypothetical protein VGB02_10985 [Pyrinomonadaceae bacterium]